MLGGNISCNSDSQSVRVHLLDVHGLRQHPRLLYKVDKVVVARLEVPGPVVDNPEDVLGNQFSWLQQTVCSLISNNSANTHMSIQQLSLQGDPDELLLLEVLHLLQADPHPGDVVVPAGAVRVPDGHHQAQLVQLLKRHLQSRIENVSSYSTNKP